MHHNIPQIVSLVSAEKRLLSKITFGFGHHNDEVIRSSCAAAGPLATLLLTRDAIPEIRVLFFTDPEFTIRTHKSRLQVFESNGTTGHAILYHPLFLDHLRYFIYGPNLPDQVIAEFCNLAYVYEYISGGGAEDLRKLARSLTNEHKLIPRNAACEFFKLALECKMDVYYARSVQDAVRTIKRGI